MSGPIVEIVFTPPPPHCCTDELPVRGVDLGTIARCSCGRYHHVVCSDWGAWRWRPVRWYHRAARRRIREWELGQEDR